MRDGITTVKPEDLTAGNLKLLAAAGVKVDQFRRASCPLCSGELNLDPEGGKARFAKDGTLRSLRCERKGWNSAAACAWKWGGVRSHKGIEAARKQPWNLSKLLVLSALEHLAAVATTQEVHGQAPGLSLSAISHCLRRLYMNHYIARTPGRIARIPQGSSYGWALDDRGRQWLAWAKEYKVTEASLWAGFRARERKK